MVRSKSFTVLLRRVRRNSPVMSFVHAPDHVTTGFIDVPEDQLQEFSTVFDNLWRLVIEIDPNMTMYAALASEDLVRKLIDTV